MSGDLSAFAVLCPTNFICEHVNAKIVEKLGGTSVELRSIDEVVCDSLEESAQLTTVFPNEFLNSKTPNGLPPHMLRLKKGTIVVLLRNLNPKEGLCNGTRLRVEHIRTSVLTATVLTGPKTGNVILLPRITLIADDSALPCKLSRYQFPIRVAFAMTINKAQGQTLERVGIYLPQKVFSHGQLYVALSRARRQSSVKVCIEHSLPQPLKRRSGFTANIVYREIL